MTATVSLPSPRDEAWRYTPVDEIAARLEKAVPADRVAVGRAVVDELAGDLGGPRLVFVNGVYEPGLSDPPPPGGGGHQRGPRPRAAGSHPDAATDAIDGFLALNRSASTDAAVISVDRDVDLGEPVHIVHVTAPGAGTALVFPRTIVAVAAGGRCTVVETFCGTPGPVVTNASTTVRAGRHSSVTYHRVQVESPQATHVGHTRVDQEAGSEVEVSSVMIGADIARSAVDVSLNEPGARVALRGLYLTAGRQRHDNVVSVDHAASGGTSTQLFKGVVDDHGRGSFSGRIVVRPGTVGTDASQSNHNLVLRPTAQADTRPWLEILADDVRCTHGATVGRLDDDALFYLRSRGIPLREARTMLIEAFVGEISGAIGPQPLRDHLGAIIAHRFHGARR